MSRILRQVGVIARRDFLAIVGTPTFILFLMAPFFMLSFGAIGGLGGAQLARPSDGPAAVVAIASASDGERLMAQDKAQRTLFRPGEGPPPLRIVSPSGEGAGQAGALLAATDQGVTAVLSGSLDRPEVIFKTPSNRHATYLAALAEGAVRSDRFHLLPDHYLSTATLIETKVPLSTKSNQQAAGYGAVFAIFVMTLLLAGQAVGMLAEEKGNKVIEILAAAVPLEAVFLGKLIGLFGVAIVFVAFWATLFTLGISALPPSYDLRSYAPAIGLPLFLTFGVLYFSMAFMLLGAVFLGIGAQASTIREIQMMSLPITLFQVGMFALSAAAAGAPGSHIATVAQMFPFSSPFAMAARGATDSAVAPHLLALGWQALWVGITIWISVRMFRLGVLKSGGGFWRSLFRRTPRPA